MALATTSVPRVIASVTGLVTAAPTFTFSVCRVLCTALRFDALFAVLRLRDAFARFEAVFVARDALFVVLRLRDAFARFEAVFVARDAVFAAVRPRALPPPALARDLDAVVFAGALLRVAAVLETVFLEAAVVFFLGAADFFAAGRPRALIPPPDLEAVVFEDLAIHNSFLSGIGIYLRLPRVSSLIESAAKARVPSGGSEHLEALVQLSPSRRSVDASRLASCDGLSTSFRRPT